MADKVYALEVDETGTPTVTPSLDEYGGLPLWVSVLLGDALGHLGMDQLYEEDGGEPLEGVRRAEYLVDAMALTANLPTLEARIEARFADLEARLAALEGEPPA